MRYKERVFTTFWNHWHSESAAFADLTERASWSQVFDSGIEVNDQRTTYIHIYNTHSTVSITVLFSHIISTSSCLLMYIMQIRKCHGRLLIIRSPMLMLFEFWIMMPDDLGTLSLMHLHLWPGSDASNGDGGTRINSDTDHTVCACTFYHHW